VTSHQSHVRFWESKNRSHWNRVGTTKTLKTTKHIYGEFGIGVKGPPTMQ